MNLTSKLVTIATLLLLLTACAGNGIIGVIYNQDGVVRRVFNHSPAEAAGILVDDRILNTGDLRGSVGSTCLVKVQRDKTYFEKFVKRVHIDSLNVDQW